MRRHAVVLALLAATLPSAAARAEEPAPPAPARQTVRGSRQRVRLFVNGTFAPTSLDFSETRTFTEFAEEGKIDTQYKNDPGPGFEVGLQYTLTRHLGASAGISVSKRDGKASYDAALPHPLYLDKPRKATGELPGLRYTENAAFFDVVFTTASSPIDFVLEGGVTRFKVQSDLVQQIAYTQAYPYDTVTVTGVPKVSSSDSPVGFNVSGSLDYHFGRHWGLGAQARYARATATLVPSSGDKVTIKAGGLQLGVGVRLYF